MTLAPCPRCARHVAVREPACPFCDAPLPLLRPRRARPVANLTRAAVVCLGATLASAGCGEDSVLDEPVVEEPESIAQPYGAPPMDPPPVEEPPEPPPEEPEIEPVEPEAVEAEARPRRRGRRRANAPSPGTVTPPPNDLTSAPAAAYGGPGLMDTDLEGL